jgi:tetratricopeptide (TPR) repeat protein
MLSHNDRVPKGVALSLILIWGLTVAVFWPGLTGGFVWDDFSLIVDNASLQHPRPLSELLTAGFWEVSSSKANLNEMYAHVYRPLVTLALFAQSRLFGLDPRGFHIVSLALHLLTVTLVFGLLRREVGISPGASLGTLAGTLLFAIHPSRAESVAWVSGSTELWVGLLVLGGYAVWVARPRSVVSASILFGLALYAKETAVVVPVALLADLYGRQGAIDWKRWGATTGFFAAFVVARFALMPFPPGAGESLAGMPRRVLATLGHYVEATLWPWRPVVERGFRYTDCSGALAVPWTTLVIGGLTAAVLLLLCLRIRALRARPLLVGLAWFFVFLAPVLNVLDLRAYGLAADRFLYLPLFGASFALALGVARAWEARPSWRMPLPAMLAALLAACGISARRHVAHFHDSPTLWRYEAAQNPTNLHALELAALQESAPGRAVWLFQHGHDRAIDNCNTALAARFALLSSRLLIGMVQDTDQDRLLTLRDFYDRAVATNHLELAWPGIRLDMRLPESFAEQIKADASLVGIPHAAVTMRTLDLARARNLVERVLKTDPDNAGAWLLLARIQARQRQLTEADRSLEQARKHGPSTPGTAELARALSEVRELASIPAHDERARRIRDAQIELTLQAPEAARRALQPELDANPGDPSVVVAYVRTMMADRRFDLAKEAIENAETRSPEHAAQWQKLREALHAP